MKTIQKLLAVITFVAVMAALRATRSVTMPVAVVIFLLVLVWPLQRRLERRLPVSVGYVITSFVVLLGVGAVATSFIMSVNLIVAKAPEYVRRLRILFTEGMRWLQERGVQPSAAEIDVQGVLETALKLIGPTVSTLYSIAGAVLFILLLFVFGLIEVRDFDAKLRSAEIVSQRSLASTVARILDRYQRYVVTKTVISAVTGVLTGLYTLLLGLDFPFIWGMLAFVLNFIPSLGSIIAVILPTLMALVQFAGLGKALVVLGGLSGLQMLLGNYIDPRMLGRYLSISPAVVLVSILFWGWVWGIPGALLGVPLTVGIALVCEAFESTRWVAALLMREPAGPAA